MWSVSQSVGVFFPLSLDGLTHEACNHMEGCYCHYQERICCDLSLFYNTKLQAKMI
jgi:hypothetical protein